jgi:3-oxoacyl-[acyl-carrier-protein] synthase II
MPAGRIGHMASVNRRVLVTGFGVISPLGPDAPSNLEALLNARDAVTEVTGFDVSRTRCKTAGQIPDEWMTDAFPCRSGFKSLHRSARMAAMALREACVSAKRPSPELLIVGTTSGGMSYGELFYRRLLSSGSRRGFAKLVANYMPQKPVMDALRVNNLRIPSQIIANACSSGSNAVGHGFELVRSGLRECVACGGYDPICELVFVGFDSLQAATSQKIRPFDKERSGMVLGEGASFLILESERSASARRANAIAEVIGYGQATDTFHLTQPDPSGIGPKLSMLRAISSAQIDPAEIDYVNAHGTATIFNDATEGSAISDLLGEVPVSSTKSMMGHALGAAGSIEAAFCVLALREQFLPPNINFVSQEAGWKFRIVANKASRARLRVALSNSIGFGGENATLILKGL